MREDDLQKAQEGIADAEEKKAEHKKTEAEIEEENARRAREEGDK